MKTKHTLLQLGKFFPPNWGGIETVTYNLAVGLTNQGNANTVVAFGDSNTTEILSVSGNIAEIHSSKHVKILHAPISIGYFLNFKRLSTECDVVVVHLPNPFAIISLML